MSEIQVGKVYKSVHHLYPPVFIIANLNDVGIVNDFPFGGINLPLPSFRSNIKIMQFYNKDGINARFLQEENLFIEDNLILESAMDYQEWVDSPKSTCMDVVTGKYIY